MEVSFPSFDETFSLFGTLALSSTEEPTPAILIIAGSGPIDRNGNVQGILGPIGAMNLNTSNRFAEFFNSTKRRPIAVLSYDKRGVGKSISASSDKNLYYRAGIADLVSDAVEGYRFLANHPRIDKTTITLLGHSEGAILLPLICKHVIEQKLDPVKGCIFLAGFGESVPDASTLQMERIIKEVNEEDGFKGRILRKAVTKKKLDKHYNEFINKIEADKDREFVSTHCGLVKMPAKWFRDHMNYDAQASLADEITCHCLAITGQKDVQVRDEFSNPDIATTLVPKAASMEGHRPDNLTHILRSLEGPSKLLNVRDDYTRLSKLPLDPELLSIMGSWCDRILLGKA
jgi:alpha-beta hydrolase superfamily lysophospholipase